MFHVDVLNSRFSGSCRASKATICIPWCVTFVLYGCFHFTYPRDMRNLKASLEKAKGVRRETAV